jgi:prophage DNA circulation protein
MASSCDPSTELWPASFRGVPFFVMNDEETGGRRLVVHEFPGRDDPFVEDLGAKARKYAVTAYLASEDATGQASALTAIATQRGAGSLVLPTHGPVQVRAEEFKRSRERDKLGYIAYTLSCVQEGFASALASASSLANLIFVAADALEVAVGPFYAASIVSDAPEYVASAAVDGFVTAVATIDVVRADNPVDPLASYFQQVALASLADAAASLVTSTPSDAATGLVVAARAIGDGLPASVAATAFLAVADATPNVSLPVTTSANRRSAAANADANARLLRIAALTAYGEAMARATFASQPQGITARADVVEYFDAEMELCNGGSDADLFDAIEGLRNSVVAYLSSVITTLAPVVTVETRIRLPAIVMAYRLYQDPTRADELVDRNRVRVPSRLPLEFAALAA